MTESWEASRPTSKSNAKLEMRPLLEPAAASLGYTTATLSTDMDDTVLDLMLGSDSSDSVVAEYHTDGTLAATHITSSLDSTKLYLRLVPDASAFADVEFKVDIEKIPQGHSTQLDTEYIRDTVIQQVFGLSEEDKNAVEGSSLPLDTTGDGMYHKSWKGTIIMNDKSGNKFSTVSRCTLSCKRLKGSIRLQTLDDIATPQSLPDYVDKALQRGTSWEDAVLLFGTVSSVQPEPVGHRIIALTRAKYQNLSDRPIFQRSCTVAVTLSWRMQSGPTRPSEDSPKDWRAIVAGSFMDKNMRDVIKGSLVDDTGIELSQYSSLLMLSGICSRTTPTGQSIISELHFKTCPIDMPVQLLSDIWANDEETTNVRATTFGVDVFVTESKQ